MSLGKVFELISYTAFEKFHSLLYGLHWIDFRVYFPFLWISEKILYSPGLPRIHYEVKIYCGLPILLPPSSEAWDCRLASSQQTHLVGCQWSFMSAVIKMETNCSWRAECKQVILPYWWRITDSVIVWKCMALTTKALFTWEKVW